MCHEVTSRKRAGLLALSGAAAFLLTLATAQAAPTPASELSTGQAEELCATLDEQYDFVMQFKSKLPYAENARTLHGQGMEKCSSGTPAEGVSDLRQSLEALYVMPNTL